MKISTTIVVFLNAAKPTFFFVLEKSKKNTNSKLSKYDIVLRRGLVKVVFGCAPSLKNYLQHNWFVVGGD